MLNILLNLLTICPFKMITAKDIFSLEREMIEEIQGLVYSSDMSPEQKRNVFESLAGEISADEFEKIRLRVLDHQLDPLVRIKNGDLLKMKDVNKAVKKAADNE